MIREGVVRVGYEPVRSDILLQRTHPFHTVQSPVTNDPPPPQNNTIVQLLFTQRYPTPEEIKKCQPPNARRPPNNKLLLEEATKHSHPLVRQSAQRLLSKQK